ncbi:DUF3693 domain-containing protein [Xylella fastidiosa]|uniref:DUF3693 domain-containing protein n=1 Tax=Xylella fastidiosa TaxID=2371 RepID=UPI00111F63F7|nr:DUF3693 domain-containing protein [Xylella fastidiosa]QGJ37775.2 helix-turn-helix domain-containing protein [Xylella fastidiosa subsp. fastidiosa]QPC11671.1 helix-turn-helix domain-containing protein [Xylella fastidiosa subsp. fastidiosa]TNV89539.1 hypothetical protein C5H25_11705 [Xylella fastidiosa]TNW00519.1 hypothetical protein C5H24_11825 [Xylella fastidiosa]TNW08994.1 hypothetical protein C5H16_10340 [Xylella fastidiosa]
MNEVKELIEKARERINVKSDAEFAKKLGVSRSSIANWKSGYSLPDTTVCAELASITGLPLAKVLGIVGEARAISREEKAVWRKLATLAATTLMIGTSITCPNRSQAQSISESSVMKVHIMHIMSAGEDGYEN